MSDNKKLVIKINYPNKPGELPDAETNNIAVITEWNIKRIAGALAVLCLLTLTGLGGYFWINSRVDTDHKSTSLPGLPANSIPPAAQADKAGGDKEAKALTKTPGDEQPAAPITVAQPIPDAAGGGGDNAQPTLNESRTSAPAPAGEVVRGRLAKSIRYKEPYGNVSIPLMLGKDDEQTIYYFTELKNMSGKQIYHEWLYKGKSVFKRPIKIAEQRWRTSTHKIIRSNALGDWSVRAIDAHGEIMHRIDFNVVAANNE